VLRQLPIQLLRRSALRLLAQGAALLPQQAA
jgi:hypothetical protein